MFQELGDGFISREMALLGPDRNPDLTTNHNVWQDSLQSCDARSHKRLGIDDVHAREIGGQRVMDKSHGWQSWEDIFALKQAIEKSGYKIRKDVEGVIQALEGMEMKNSLGHPQGDKLIRKEDHVGIIDCYISRVEGGKLEVKKRIPKEELAKNMPLRHDLSKMPT